MPCVRGCQPTLPAASVRSCGQLREPSRLEYPEYRLITPHGSTLPNEITDEWALAETAISIEGGLEKEIGPGGYHLYKSSRMELKKGMDPS